MDTIYASVGRKPALLRELVETAISGSDEAVPAEQRDYVQRIHGADTAREKTDHLRRGDHRHPDRMAPIFRALRDAAIGDNDCAALWQEISDRRAANMRLFAAEPAATGDLREDLDDAMVADVIWSMNAAEYWDLLVTRRGWAADEFRDFLADAWHRLLLAGPLPGHGHATVRRASTGTVTSSPGRPGAARMPAPAGPVPLGGHAHLQQAHVPGRREAGDLGPGQHPRHGRTDSIGGRSNGCTRSRSGLFTRARPVAPGDSLDRHQTGVLARTSATSAS